VLDMVAGCTAERVSTLNRASVGAAESKAATTLTMRAPRAIGSERSEDSLSKGSAGTRKVLPTGHPAVLLIKHLIAAILIINSSWIIRSTADWDLCTADARTSRSATQS